MGGTNITIKDMYKRFKTCLTQFVMFNQKYGIKTLFILEAQENKKELELHASMSRVAKDHNIPLVNLHNYIQNHKSNQALFWDNVHFTDRGHVYAAQALVPHLTKLLQ